MAFVKIDKSPRGGFGDVSVPAVTMGAYLADGKAHKAKSIVFRITRALTTQLGWTLDDKFGIAVHEGTDSDKGFMQLVFDPTGYRGSQGEGQQGIAFSLIHTRFKHYVLNECPISSMLVNHVVDGDTLVIECPDWLRYNPQSVPEPEPSRVTPILNREQRRAVGARVARNLKR